MKKLILMLFAVAVFAQKLFWYSDYKKAFEAAKKGHKLVMVDISKHGCAPCEFMKENIFESNKIKKIFIKHFVLVSYYVDVERVPEFFRENYFNFTPTILFYNYKGKLIKTIYGATSYKNFLKTLNLLVKGK